MTTVAQVSAIESGKVYTLTEFKRITGMGDQSLRDARRTGLRVVYHSRQAYIAGDDFHKWIMQPERRTEHYSVTALSEETQHAPPQEAQHAG